MKVLVAIDNSASSEKVLQAAVAGSWPSHTNFCVLNIVNLLSFERLPALIESERFVDEGAKRIREAGSFPLGRLQLILQPPSF